MTAGLLGGMIVSAAGLFVGVSAALEKSAAAKKISEALGVVCALKREICGRLSPLPVAVERVRGEFRGCVFLTEFERLCAARGYETAPDCWREVVRSGGFGGEVEAALGEISAVIGRYDSREQQEAFEAAAERLEALYCEAREYSRAMGRVYVTLGACGGVAIAILLG